MKILSIQPIQSSKKYSQPLKSNRTLRNEPEIEKPISFKAKGDGFLIGLGTGTAITLLTTGIVAITGGLAIPAIVVAAGGIAGGIAGDKIEEKINNKK